MMTALEKSILTILEELPKNLDKLWMFQSSKKCFKGPQLTEEKLPRKISIISWQRRHSDGWWINCYDYEGKKSLMYFGQGSSCFRFYSYSNPLLLFRDLAQWSLWCAQVTFDSWPPPFEYTHEFLGFKFFLVREIIRDLVQTFDIILRFSQLILQCLDVWKFFFVIAQLPFKPIIWFYQMSFLFEIGMSS